MSQGQASHVFSFFKHVVPFRPHLPAPERQFLRTRSPFTTIALGVIALHALVGAVRAENECGAPLPGGEIVCSPFNYDPSDGNIFYGPDEANEGDFSIRLTDGLSINYDRNNPHDDIYFVDPDDPETGRYSAVWITPTDTGFGYTGDISLYSSADVTSNGRGISVGHYGESGALRMELTDGAITTTGPSAHAVLLRHEGEGALNVDVRGGGIVTRGLGAHGIWAQHTGDGRATVAAQALAIDTAGEDADGIRGFHFGAGDVNVDVRGGGIVTRGLLAHGILAQHTGDGRVTVAAQALAIDTAGEDADGIRGFHFGAGDVNVDVRGGGIVTRGLLAHGILAQHTGDGRVTVAAQALAIDTAGEDADGIRGYHFGAGDVNVDVRGGGIVTRGLLAHGILAYHAGDGRATVAAQALAIDTAGGMISTEGRGSHGIHALHESGRGEIRIAVDGGSIHASGPEASGIRVGRLGEAGGPAFAAGMGEDGYRRQTVTVNAPVTGGSGADAAGVFLAGGGRVVLGPRGSVGAASGVAILVAGGAPRLHVDLNLAGRRVGTVLQEGAIRNDGGSTTLRVNGVLLHDGVAGATGRTVLNGAWDLTLRSSDTIADRDFSAQDFTETYAPRAAVYEALPGLLLRLHSRGPAGERLTAPASPAWVRVAGGGGRYTPVQASVGAAYDYRRVEVEAGLDVELGPRLTGTLSVRHVYGWGDVSSPTGGGTINTQGLGGAVGLAWTGPQGYYFRGRVSVMDYDVDLTADRRGTLIKEASAVGHSLGFETGRRFTLSERLKLTPRVWATRSKIDLGFTDAVQSRLWAEDSDRMTAGTGLVAETACSWDDGAQAFAVRGSLDLWRTLGDGTAVNVSQGAPLKSVSDKTRVLLSLGGVYRWGRFSVSSDVAAGGPGSRDQEYAGFLNLGVQF